MRYHTCLMLSLYKCLQSLRNGRRFVPSPDILSQAADSGVDQAACITQSVQQRGWERRGRWRALGADEAEGWAG